MTAAELGVPVGPLDGLTKVPVYNLVPKEGQPARFGFRILSNEVFLEADVDWSGDYHEGFTIAVPESPIGKILKNRLVFDGRAGNGTFLTLPSTCFDPAQSGFEHVYSTLLRADSKENPNPTFPNGLLLLRGGAAARGQADRLRQSALRADYRRRPRHAAGRFAQRAAPSR